MTQVMLYFKEGSSDKVYQVQIVPAGDSYLVNFAYGRRGSTLQTGSKTQVPVDLATAERIYNKLVAEKKAKGYKESEDGGATYTAVDPEDTGIRPQLLTAIDEKELNYFLLADAWWAQEKLDGRRRLIKKEGDVLTAINRKGLAVGISETILARLRAIPYNFVLDGEDLGDRLIVFDRIEVASRSYSRRLEWLDELGLDGPVTVLYTARNALEKQALYENLQANRCEGIVFKHRESTYTGAVRTSDQVKFKFYATASVSVIQQNAQRSVAIAVADNGSKIAVGNVTIPPNQPIPPVGSVIEVRYLYAYPGGSLYQPTCLGIRDDVEPDPLSSLKLKPADEDPA